MAIHQFHSDLGQPNASTVRPQKSKMSILGIIFFIMGVPNLYAFMQRRTETATYNGSGVPRYAFVVMVAIAIASLVELSIIY